MEKMKKNLLALKPYLESVKEQCSRLSKDKLTDIVLGLAKEVPANQRIGFLETLERLSQEQPSMIRDEGILEQIEALKGDIRKRMASIEDGSYYEDHYDRRHRWDYEDELPDDLSEEQKDELEEFFEDAARFFLSGQLEKARDVYAALFRLPDDPYEKEEGDAFYISGYPLEMDMREARARYCRCVYETTPLSKRVPAMLAAMNVHVRLSEFRFDVYENHHPMFCDVMDSKPGELAHQNEFLSGWRDALSRESSDRADMLLLEAVYLLEGNEGVQSRVRSWGARQPRGWL
ncbi:MAG TPA: hypothetical protein VMX75_00730, partial [Spirochaetia bacterium]|nr:hypothetical protein [Spirochaetia bacterium]